MTVPTDTRPTASNTLAWVAFLVSLAGLALALLAYGPSLLPAPPRPSNAGFNLPGPGGMVALFCGIPLVGIIGLAIGLLARPKAASGGNGRRLATAAIVFGVIGGSSPLVSFAAMWVRDVRTDRELVNDTTRRAMAAHAWASAAAKREGRYPAELDAPTRSTLDEYGFVYHGNGLPALPPEQARTAEIVLLEVRLHRRGVERRVLVFANGQTAFADGQQELEVWWAKDRRARQDLGLSPADHR